MRYFFKRKMPPEFRVLLIESGSRHLLEGMLPKLNAMLGSETPLGLITCYSGLPAGFPPETKVYNITGYAGGADRKRLYMELAQDRYTILGILCSAEPIMTKWKWAIAAHVPAKILIVNENGDYFWFDRNNWKTIRGFVLFRAGLTGPDAVRTLGRVVLFPVTLAYLMLYAATVHVKRGLRLVACGLLGKRRSTGA